MTLDPKIPCSVILITKNEEQNLPRVLDSLEDFEEVLVVDSESTDRTQALARERGAKVFTRHFDNFAAQKNFALEQASQEWVFSLDADESPDRQLIQSIALLTKDHSARAAGYRVRRRNIHFGRELKWGAQGADFPVRVFQKAKGKFSGIVHECVKVSGKTEPLKGELLHESSRTVSAYLQKLSHYTELEAKAANQKRTQSSFWHWGLKPFLRFLYTYFLRLGFLDGFEGFLFHSLSSFYLTVKEVRLTETAAENL